MVLTAALDNHKVVLVIIAILTSVIGAVYYLNVIKNIYFDATEYEKSYIFVNTSVSNTFSITLSLIFLLLSLFILTPNEILDMTDLLALHNYTLSGF
jgi:NADH-ubiquinone oxidoreductase chain 2